MTFVRKMGVRFRMAYLIFLTGLSFGIIYPNTLLGDDSSGNSTSNYIGSKKKSLGEVEVELTPLEYKAGRLAVSVVVTTHTVNNLHTYDLEKIVRLETSGVEIAPRSVPKLRGHHSRGKIVFAGVNLGKAFSIRFAKFHSDEDKVFSWP